MVPFVDIAMVVWLRGMFPTLTVTYAPIEQSRQALARETQNQSVGIPGISIYRTACPKWKSAHTLVQAQEGFKSLTENPNNLGQNRTIDKVQLVRVMAEYTMKAWTMNVQDRDSVERTLAFSDVFKTITYQVKGLNQNNDSYNISGSAAFEGEDPTYDQSNVDEKTGRVIWYGLEKRFQVSTAWMNTHQEPAILSILTQFQPLFEGQVVDSSLFENITVVPM